MLLRAVLFFLLGAVACQSDQPVHSDLQRGMYFWKSVFKYSSYEKEILKSLKINKLYVKVFDIDWDFEQQRVIYKAPLIWRDSLPNRIELVPTIFLTNRTFEHLPDANLEIFTEDILQNVQEKTIGKPWNEIQMDCDWTKGTKQKFFAFLKILKVRLSKRQLSVTIRLHQVKFADLTGVPPADRGVLMFYNMGNWTNITTPNAVLDLAIASRYTDYLTNYPLPLDVALPTFRQTLVYRNGVFHSFLNQLTLRELTQSSFLQTQNEHFFEVQNDTLAWGISLRRGDYLRYDDAPTETLEKSVKTLSQKIPSQALTLCLFHLDSTQIAPYGHENLQKLFTLFR
jgi:hypothetical protein